MRRSLMLVLAVAAAVSTEALAAQEIRDQNPVISSSATGSVEIEADYAVVTLGVLIQDSTATVATMRMDVRLAAVADTLVGLGFPAESLPTAHYRVSPNRSRGQTTVDSYTASAAVRVTVRDLQQLPTVIEAALAVGATDVNGLRFGASDEREARDDALRLALQAARRDAEVLAEAAGGRLGDPIELTTSHSRGYMARGAVQMDMARSVELSADITPDAIVVDATVNARWSFVKH